MRLKPEFCECANIVPRILDEMMRDPEKAEAVTAAFMPMKKLDLEVIRRAGETK
jgi:predicted 3-demethylubiquinone-9 3-methyltransferase (glyoxalase superfamily)